MPEDEFRNMFRLSRNVASELIDQILTDNQTLYAMRMSEEVPFKFHFLAVLNFFGNGVFQNEWLREWPTAVSHSLHIVLNELIKLMGKYIKFPFTPKERSAVKLKFMEKLGMPEIVGVADASHFAIVRPKHKENGYLYLKSKHFNSINLLAVCDANMKFTFVDAQFPGSVNDNAVWQLTRLKQRINEDDSNFILGDSNFSSTNVLLTPIMNTDAGSTEERYNTAHKHAHSIIHRAFIVLKARFGCLRRVLHYNPSAAGRIIYACMILHNICLERMTEDVLLTEVLSEVTETMDEIYCNVDDEDVNALYVRDLYIARNFSNSTKHT